MLKKIKSIKEKYGDNLIILGHHYQRPEIISVSDHVGDSFELSRLAAQAAAKYIVFCGVHFMAESAEILSNDDQAVILPDKSAGCPMADMADLSQVKEAWLELADYFGEDRLAPIVYMNSTAEIKAFCGAHGGAVCTSGNARTICEWALKHNRIVFFLPDQYLGRNTGRSMGLSPGEILLWDPRTDNRQALSGGTGDNVRMIVWNGYCPVHYGLTLSDLEEARRKHTDASIHVHPECRDEVVKAADGSGSTSYLVRIARQAAPGAAIYIGTEIHLVERLASELPERKILPLGRIECADMSKTTPEKLLSTLERIKECPRVQVPPETAAFAALALKRMLDLSK